MTVPYLVALAVLALLVFLAPRVRTRTLLVSGTAIGAALAIAPAVVLAAYASVFWGHSPSGDPPGRAILLGAFIVAAGAAIGLALAGGALVIARVIGTSGRRPRG